MKSIAFVLLVVMSIPARAGELWEIESTSTGPDGTPITHSQRNCFPNGSVDPATIMGEMGSCTFDQKNGDASALTFALTCTVPGMPAGTGAMKVSGDAQLNGDEFNMRYTITPGGSPSAAGGDFKMSGSAKARKIGACSER